MYDPRKDQASQQKQKLQQMLMGVLMGGGGMGGGVVNPQAATSVPGLMGMMAPGANQPNRLTMGGMQPGNVGNMLTAGASPDVLKMLMASFGGR